MASAASVPLEIGMDLFFVRKVKGPPFKGNEEMHYEGVRLITFKDWPNWGSVWPTVLAKAGFFYTKTADQVACFCCGGRLKTWEAGDSPMTEHTRFFPQCGFAMGRDTRNVPLGDTTVELPPVTSRGQNSQRRNTHAPSNYYSSLASYAGAIDRPSSSLALNAQVQQQASRIGQYESLSALSTTDGLPGQQRSRHMLSGGTPLVSDQRFTLEQLQEMKLESRRLDSFSNWPTTAYVRKENLAKAGLYYLGIADRVKCAFCNGILRNWDAGDEPMVEHRKFFPNCGFLADARSAGNVTTEEETVNNQHASQNVVANPTPSSELGIVIDRPIHQNYAIEAERLATFRQWPQDAHLTPEALASAGFFYTGFGDNVKCFYCDGGLRNWEMGDDAWTEHARWFPRCNYVKTVKGQDFILQTQTAYTGQGVTIPTSNTAARTTQASSTAVGRFPVEPRAVRARMDTSMVQMVLQMGYARDLLHRVIENRLATVGDDFLSVQSLMEAVFAAEETNTSSPSSHPQQNNTATSAAAEPAASSGTAASSGAAAAEPSSTSETAAGRSKNQRKKKKNKSPGASSSGNVAETSAQPSEPETQLALMEDQRLQCKICMDDEAKILFLPCGHLCCCSKCAPALRNCPICRAVIRGTVRVYLP